MYEVVIFLLEDKINKERCFVEIAIDVPVIGWLTHPVDKQSMLHYPAYMTALKIASAFPDKNHVNIKIYENVEKQLYDEKKAVATVNDNHQFKNTSLPQEVKQL